MKTITIKYDEYSANPRKECDNLGTMVCAHRRYDLGDEEPWFDRLVDECRSWDEVEHRLKKDEGAVVILPLYLYDHGGLTISTGRFSCPWDSGQVGFIYLTREKIKQEYGWTRLTAKRRERLTKYLKGEVELYDQYVRGDMYGFVIEDDDGNEHDSCWGFFGEDIDGVACHTGLPKETIQQAFNEPGKAIAI